MKTSKRVRAVLLEPYCVLREGLGAILRRAGIEVVGEFDSLSKFLPWFPNQALEVVVVGYHLHSVASMSWLQFCCRRRKGPGILVLNGLNHPRHARAVLELGARGVIDLRANADEVVKAVRLVAEGRRYFSAPDGKAPSPALDGLSAREFDVLMLTAMGFRLKEIAERLGVAAQTAYSYRRRVGQKLQLKSPPAMVRFACDHGLLIQDQAPRRVGKATRRKKPRAS